MKVIASHLSRFISMVSDTKDEHKYLKHNTALKTTDNTDLVKYFDQYQVFCFDLNSDNVLKGDVNFNYK